MPSTKDDAVPENPPDALQGVVALIHAGRLVDARNALEEIVRRDPENAKAHRLLGATLIDLREYPQARSVFAHALTLDPRNGRTRAYYLAATRLTQPAFNLFSGKSRRASSARAAALIGMAVLLLLFFQNPIEAGALLFVLLFLSLIALHFSGTIVIARDRRVRRALRPEESVPAYWFFGNFVVALVLGVAATVTRDARFGWISATCVVSAFAAAMYAIPASLPDAARGFYRAAAILAWLGLAVSAVGLALGVDMALKMTTAAHPMAWTNAMLTLLFSSAIASVFTLLLFLLIARLFDVLPRRRR